MARLAEFSEKWQAKYPAAVRAWERSWSEVVPFLAFPSPIRKIISTTNAIESLNARYRRSVNACGPSRTRPPPSSGSTSPPSPSPRPVKAASGGPAAGKRP
ncbi:transposase [Streptomyces sp. NPDC057910]|uniref:transposase n=1 Tax=Streptomyces sp. NPDC057910 TaxID=3346278 RepID=UPI0036EF3AD6